MRIISLFSGAGAFDLGLIQEGHEIIFANDIDKDAVDTYSKNIGNHIILEDISKIPSELILDGDVVMGGFPCQGFSRANLRRSISDERNKLYLELLRVIREKQPRYFLAENVRGLLSLDGGKVIEIIEEDFSSAGYRVDKKLFNMADFGVPQNRWRVIIAGTRNDLSLEANFPFPKPTHRKISNSSQLEIERSSLKPWVTVSEALAGIPEPEDGKNQIPNHVYSKYKVTNRNFTGHRRTDPNKPSPTILARGDGKGGVCAIQHPNNHRRMTVRESAVIQTFPIDFEFFGSMNSCYRQVGNAVPVLFAKALGKQLKVPEKKLEA